MTTFINLTDREYEQLQEDIVKVIRSPTTWLDMIPQHPLPSFGIKDYSWYKQYDMGAIQVSMTGSTESFGAGYLSKSTAYIPVFSKDIKIFKRDLEASRLWGGAMDTRTQSLAAEKLIAKLDTVPGLGITSPIDANPITQDVTDVGAGADWGTVANILLDWTKAVINLKSANYFGPYNAILSSPLEPTLEQFVAGTPMTYRDWVNRQVTGQIRPTNSIATGDGTAFGGTTGTDNVMFVFQPQSMGQNNFELLIAKQPTLEDLSQGKFDPQFKLYAAMIHEIFRSDAGAVLDAITDLGT